MPARPLTEEIHDAARSGNLDQLKKLITDTPSLVNSLDKDKMTPLHQAIDAGELRAASFLIESGADIHLTDYKEQTPLHIAAYQGNAGAVKLLLKNGADCSLREMRDRTPLFLAVNMGNDLETVQLLIDAGSDVNDINSRGEGVLVSALFYGQKEIIDLLIDKGATIPDDEQTLRQVLYVTASNGMVRPFNMAVEICQEQDIDWWTGVPIHASARGGSVDITEALIAKGLPFKEKNRYGVLPQHIAAENGRTELVEFFLSKGAEIDEPSLMGKTALHFAQENGHETLAVLLVQKGASTGPIHFPVLEGDYLGEKTPGDTPQMFAPGIVSSHGFSSEHSPAVFSPDGKEVYWTLKFRGPILVMRQEKGVWTAPEPASFCSEYGEGEPIFSPDGTKLYFLSMRPMEPSGPSGKENIWYVEKSENGWSEPRPVSPLINAYDLHWLFSVSNKGTIYFASPSGKTLGANDIYCSKLVDGEYEEPQNLGAIINTAGIDHTPFIAPDESYLIYVSTGGSPSPRDMKFYISYRDSEGTWMNPKNGGQKINSISQGLCPVITADGKYMFFIGQGDIYWVEAAFIDELRPKK